MPLYTSQRWAILGPSFRLNRDGNRIFVIENKDDFDGVYGLIHLDNDEALYGPGSDLILF